MTPQEKKQLSLKKDCRNTYGENDKSSRKAIKSRKRWVNRSYRREINQKLGNSSSKDIQSDAEVVQRKTWKKFADTPVGEIIIRDINKKMEYRLWHTSLKFGCLETRLESFLNEHQISKSRIKVIMRRVRAITFDRVSSTLDLNNEDIGLLDEFLLKTKLG
ncbi:hypothetical protein [Rubritalea tangerina]|uniref:Uncharacterized protein n=1 Tax=Rubritalea tangerina TaxID=430798 RepID=A0ABW4Z7T8_9BACT